jgi:hypothetical protein
MNGATAKPAAQACDTDAAVPVNVGGSVDRTFILLENADDAAVTVTFGPGAGVQAHLAKSVAVTLSASGGGTDKKLVGPFESAMVNNADGTLTMTVDAATGAPALNVWAFRLPKM